MPGAPAPFLDTWAPAQYVFGSSGGAGPARSPQRDDQMNGSASQTYDQALHWKLAGTIILALVTVFVLQQLGFRFVVAAGIGG